MERALRYLWMLMAVMAARPVLAGDLLVTLKDGRGAPVANAVVSLIPETPVDLKGWMPPPAVMKQQNTRFSPFVLAVRAGTTVSFPNFDGFRHHVYSFSKARQFELRLYGQDETKKVTFDKPGVVALGCNIHDNMLAYIYVTKDPVYGMTGRDGSLTLAGLPAGRYALHVWQPDLETVTAGSEAVILSADGAIRRALTLKMKSPRHEQLPPAEEVY